MHKYAWTSRRLKTGFFGQLISEKENLALIRQTVKEKTGCARTRKRERERERETEEEKWRER